jgi:hypothetical protein
MARNEPYPDEEAVRARISAQMIKTSSDVIRLHEEMNYCLGCKCCCICPTSDEKDTDLDVFQPNEKDADLDVFQHYQIPASYKEDSDQDVFQIPPPSVNAAHNVPHVTVHAPTLACPGCECCCTRVWCTEVSPLPELRL